MILAHKTFYSIVSIWDFFIEYDPFIIVNIIFIV